jgi:hypothetical protein
MHEVMGLVLRRGVTPTVIGIVLGFGGALPFSRLLAGRLYGVSGLDPMTYAVAAVAMMNCIAPQQAGWPRRPPENQPRLKEFAP